jgi:toxin YoeB
MPNVTVRQLKWNADALLDELEARRQDILVDRGEDEQMVILPQAELHRLRETLHLLSTPSNTERLYLSITELDAGLGVNRPWAAEVLVYFSDAALADYAFWVSHEPDVATLIDTLITECTVSPYAGMGRPEALVGGLQGWVTRFIQERHRLVYRVRGVGANAILEIAGCRFYFGR